MGGASSHSAALCCSRDSRSSRTCDSSMARNLRVLCLSSLDSAGLGVTTSVIPRSRLVRGLPIASEISATHYLRGGEPDLLLPSAQDPGTATVTLDGLTEEIVANGFPLELRRFVKNGGLHNINADGQELAFTTIDEHPSPHTPAGTATIGWSGNQQLIGADQSFEILGAQAGESSEVHSILVRRGRMETWLLHENGHAEELAEPGPPPFSRHD